jgi:hypothetical protein
MPSASAKPGGVNTRIVEPCSNQPSSWPLATRVLQGISFGPFQRRCSSTFKACRRMLATSTAATGTSATGWPCASCSRSTARSLRQNSRSTRASAIGLTFQVSPLR